jgi:hypothetical protein
VVVAAVTARGEAPDNERNGRDNGDRNEPRIRQPPAALDPHERRDRRIFVGRELCVVFVEKPLPV